MYLLKERFGLSGYVPEITLCTDKKHVRVVPFFPGYFFLQVNLYHTPLSSINTSYGVRRIITFGESPEPIPVAIIDTIHEHIDELNRSGYSPFHDFSIGETVQMKNGPLHNLEMVFAGPMQPSQRVFVLLNILGQLRKVQVDRNKIKHTLPPSPVQKKRYTRGRGRKIHYT
ncbi:hypothetical protein KDA_40100 [Dictyobacter alpinus]|uniref:NusG-like N-terminal domain-containing protein n=1 Tax=Dictyobacter alpinus TaxID=2014873 RepID=A0A402BB39_9CHLR|nr:hypothetical protein KDA_40100 [Dictyobacter alpinus]